MLEINFSENFINKFPPKLVRIMKFFLLMTQASTSLVTGNSNVTTIMILINFPLLGISIIL